MKKWKIDDAKDMPLAVIEDTEEGMGICEIQDWDERKMDAHPSQLKNAHLIAKVPEMVSALETITLHAFDEDTDIGQIKDDFEAMREIAFLMLSKIKDSI